MSHLSRKFRPQDFKWKIRPAGLCHLVVSCGVDGPGLSIDGELFGQQSFAVPLFRSDYHALADTQAAAAWMASGLPLAGCHVLGKRRLLSLDSDKTVYAQAWNIAAALRAGKRGVRSTDYPQEAIYGLMHAIVPKLRIHAELVELVEQHHATRIYVPTNRIFDAFCLRGFLERGLSGGEALSSNAPARDDGTECRKQWPVVTTLAFVDAEARERPFADRALLQLKNELAAFFELQTVNAAPDSPDGRMSIVSPLRVVALYRTLRKAGQSRAAAWLIAWPAALYEGGTLARLNEIAACFRARARSHVVTVVTNISRLPVLFAVAGAHAGGGRTAAIETMLVTRLRRYSQFQVDDRFVIDEGQAKLLGSTGALTSIRACGSVLIEARQKETRHTATVPPKVIIASQPSDREMRRIMKLSEGLPGSAEIRIAPHAEDQAAFRTWLSGMVEGFRNRDVQLNEAGEDPLTHAAVVITATSNIAIVAQTLGIPAIMVAARRDLEDIWQDGPYPGLWVDPEEEGAEGRFLDAYQRALAGDMGDYRHINQKHLLPGVAARIAAAFAGSLGAESS